MTSECMFILDLINLIFFKNTNFSLVFVYVGDLLHLLRFVVMLFTSLLVVILGLHSLWLFFCLYIDSFYGNIRRTHRHKPIAKYHLPVSHFL